MTLEPEPLTISRVVVHRPILSKYSTYTAPVQKVKEKEGSKGLPVTIRVVITADIVTKEMTKAASDNAPM